MTPWFDGAGRYNQNMLMAPMIVGVCLSISQFSADPGHALESISPGIHGQATRNLIILSDPRIEDKFFPVNVNNWWGLMNQRGRLVVEPKFDWTDHSFEGITRVVTRGQTYYIKGNGTLFFEEAFVYADRFAQGRAIVGNGSHFGIIDKRGELIVAMHLDGALRFREGLVAVMVNKRCGFINVAGKVEVPLRYERVRSFHEGLAMAELPRSGAGEVVVRGYINRRGQWQVRDTRGQFSELGDFHDGLARVKVGMKWGYLDRAMKLSIEPAFEAARDFYNGIAAVRINYQWGLIDKRGKFTLQPQFEDADDLDESLVQISHNALVGFVDLAGKHHIRPQYRNAEPFLRGLAFVETDDGWGYIDAAGRWIWNPVIAKQGFVDRRLRETVAIVANTNRNNRRTHHATVSSPLWRPAIPRPYPAEYRYEEVLPSPQRDTP